MKDTNRKARRTFGVTIPGKVAEVVTMIVNDFDVNPIEALNAFYASPTYANLEREETKYWHFGAVALYDDFLETTGRK